MLVAVRDVSLKHADDDPFGLLDGLGISSVDLLVERDMTTSRLANAAGEPYDLTSEDGRADLTRDLSERGIGVCAITLMTDFSREPLADEVSWMVKGGELASELGAPVVRIDPWVHDRQMEGAELITRIARAVHDAIDATDRVEFAIENHGGQGNRPEFLDGLFSQVASDRFGLTLDTGNFYWYGHPLDQVYELMERFAPLVKHAHVKNISYPADKRQVQREVGWEYLRYVCPIPDGDVDHERVVSILSRAGYERSLTIEDESHVNLTREQFAEALQRDVDHLKSLVG